MGQLGALPEPPGPLFGVGGSPSNTKSPGQRHTSIPSGILVHPAVWVQRLWVGGCACRGGESYQQQRTLQSDLQCLHWFAVSCDILEVTWTWCTVICDLICCDLRCFAVFRQTAELVLMLTLTASSKMRICGCANLRIFKCLKCEWFCGFFVDVTGKIRTRTQYYKLKKTHTFSWNRSRHNITCYICRIQN